MIELGYKLSSEEQPPRDLVRYAQRAEDAGFTFAAISDHFHPWTSKQGESPFVWNVIGAIAQATTDLKLGTAVTCPTIRIHPAIVAQAAATSAAMMPGRFWLGIGSGENLNEHVTGQRWPQTRIRQDMMVEAVEVIRTLFEGGMQSHHGRYYTVENARLYTLEERPPIYVAASGPRAARLAGEHSDGLICVAPAQDTVEKFEAAGGAGKPKYAEVNVCWAASEEEAKKTALEWWPVAGLGGTLMQELALPSHFEAAAEPLDADKVSETLAVGPDPDVHIENIRKFVDAGFDHVWIHQIGPDQDGFFDFYEKQVLPKLR
ncbi:MAG TPA: TIGR03557 family F420-dependent LLM class oxidoreductase [Actinomycetota bacterium]|nr:TIGR03557 family F420-dependent LLM class oxidoreductase [Actinomycetota bacterium]